MNNDTNLPELADWLHLTWSDEQYKQFERFESWLISEAAEAGGIGPREYQRIRDRHTADSLAFVKIMNPTGRTVVDVGSGVGLPAIPIAIALPHVSVTILDRSERRIRLAARACRVLGLENVEIVMAPAETVTATYDAVTFRASLKLQSATAIFQQLAKSGGEGLFALSRRNEPNESLVGPEGTTFSVELVDSEVLDSPAWILRMKRTTA